MTVQIFVVEDDVSVREVIQDILVEGGFEVAVAGTGEEAVSTLDGQAADYRALVTDIDLRCKLSGWDVARHARQINEQIAVVYITAADGHEWASQGVPKSLLLTKPFADAQLLTAVSQLVNEAGGTA